MKTVEDLITYQKDIMSSYGILDAEKAIEKQKDMENKQEAELAKKVMRRIRPRQQNRHLHTMRNCLRRPCNAKRRRKKKRKWQQQ